jgi:acyl-CoA synthetase (AMP-forming)/AMP-acid ligase II/thioesterase domain-containing protein/acyl carrier protein
MPQVTLFHQLFETQAQRYPERIAIKTENISLSYAQLNAQANQLAHHLINLQKAPETRIGIFIDRSELPIISILAIMKAGLCFVPLNPSSTPAKRLKYYINDAQIDTILTNSNYCRHSLLRHLNDERTKPIAIINLNKFYQTTNDSSENPQQKIEKNRLLYVMYTSGTIGQPKGVAIEYKGLTLCLNGHLALMKIRPSCNIAQNLALDSDGYLAEITMALGTGACLHIVPEELRKKLHALGAFFSDNNINISIFTPSILRNKYLKPEHFKTLNYVISIGESVDETTINNWRKGGRASDNLRIFLNGYGPAEVTICTTLGICEQLAHIGQPIEGIEVFVLERNFRCQPSQLIHSIKKAKPGEEGELYISGENSLARGYINNPKLTSQRFFTIRHPENGEPIKVFRTRDGAKYEKNGKLTITGRLDRCRKIYSRWFNPYEMETIIQSLPSIRGAYVDITHPKGHPIITAYLASNKQNCQLKFREIYIAVLEAVGIAPSRWAQVDTIPIDAKSSKVAHTQLRGKHPIHYLRGESEQTITEKFEIIIANIWKPLLDLPRQMTCYIDDNFFELGGTSLLCAQLISELKQRYQFRITLEEFLINPTIGCLAKQLYRHQKNILQDATCLTQMRAGNIDLPPIFLIHTLLGDAEIDYANFLKNWKSQHPIYEINARGLEQPALMPDCFYWIAKDYIDAIKTIYPSIIDKPCLLIGWSAGGIIANEMRHQLGKKTKVVVIDAESPNIFRQLNRTAYLTHLKKTITFIQPWIQLTSTLGIKFDVLENLSKIKQIYNLFAQIRKKIEKQQDELIRKKNMNRLDVIKNILIACLEDKESILAPNTTLLIAEKTLQEWGTKNLGWITEKTNQIKIIPDSDHQSIMRNQSFLTNIIGHIQLSFKEFLNHLDTRKIIKKIITQHAQLLQQQAEMLNIYIPICGYEDKQFENTVDIYQKTIDFLKPEQTKRKVLLLLGNSGLGKTTFLQYLFSSFHKKNTANNIMLFITLSSIRNPINELMHEHLQTLGLSKQEINLLKIHKTPITLILDAYDEMQSDKQQNIYVTNKLHEWNIKIILSCRSSFLFSRPSWRSFFVPLSNTQRNNAALETLTLLPFTKDQITAYIHRYLKYLHSTEKLLINTDWEKVISYQKSRQVTDRTLPKLPADQAWDEPDFYIQSIQTIPGLGILVSTPYLLKITMSSLPKVLLFYLQHPTQQNFVLTCKNLYDIFVEQLFERQENKLIQTGRLPTDGDIKDDYREYSQALASKMEELGVTSITYTKKHSLFKKTTPNEWDQFFDNSNPQIARAREGCPLKREICSQLRGETQRISFTHESLRLYFVSDDFFHKWVITENEMKKTQAILLKDLQPDDDQECPSDDLNTAMMINSPLLTRGAPSNITSQTTGSPVIKTKVQAAHPRIAYQEEDDLSYAKKLSQLEKMLFDYRKQLEIVEEHYNRYNNTVADDDDDDDDAKIERSRLHKNILGLKRTINDLKQEMLNLSHLYQHKHILLQPPSQTLEELSQEISYENQNT